MYQALDWKANNQLVEEQTDGKVKKLPTKEKSTLKCQDFSSYRFSKKNQFSFEWPGLGFEGGLKFELICKHQYNEATCHLKLNNL